MTSSVPGDDDLTPAAAVADFLPDATWPQVAKVGGWWPRNNTPEIDLVGATRQHDVQFAGSITWRSSPLTARDVAALSIDATSIPGIGAGTPLVAVCPGSADPRRVRRPRSGGGRGSASRSG